MSDQGVQRVCELQAFESAVSQVESSRRPCEALLVQSVSNAVKPALLHVRSIAATYSMASRPAPVKASHYVGSLLRGAEVC